MMKIKVFENTNGFKSISLLTHSDPKNPIKPIKIQNINPTDICFLGNITQTHIFSKTLHGNIFQLCTELKQTSP